MAQGSFLGVEKVVMFYFVWNGNERESEEERETPPTITVAL